MNSAILPPAPTTRYSFSPPKLIHSHSIHAIATSSSSSSPPPTAVIIGAGLSGLAAATHLHSLNLPFLLLDSSDSVGGRVRTDTTPDGFLLDRGFQILLTAYPECRRLLHYPSLRLRPFYPGALVLSPDRRFHRLADRFRRPLDSLPSLLNPVGSLPDKLLVGLNRLVAASRSDADILTASPETTISQHLYNSGFSPSIVNTFFKPFLGGIFFDQQLQTTSRLYNFIIKCLALGDNALPEDGIAAIPNQLANRLPKDSIRLNCKAVAIEASSSSVRLEDGNVIQAELGVIVAVEQPEAEKLLLSVPTKTTITVSSDRSTKRRSTVCLYFSADRAPVRDPILILNGSGQGIVNNMFFATNVAPTYGPKGKVLVSVSLVGGYDGWSDEDLTVEVVRELGEWFGKEGVDGWRHLRTYRIGFAQPDQSPPTDLTGKDPRVGDGVYVCGDFMSSATFDGALVAGRKAAEALVEDRRRSPIV